MKASELKLCIEQAADNAWRQYPGTDRHSEDRRADCFISSLSGRLSCYDQKLADKVFGIFNPPAAK
jgi:hypothetical protein